MNLELDHFFKNDNCWTTGFFPTQRLGSLNTTNCPSVVQIPTFLVIFGRLICWNERQLVLKLSGLRFRLDCISRDRFVVPAETRRRFAWTHRSATLKDTRKPVSAMHRHRLRRGLLVFLVSRRWTIACFNETINGARTRSNGRTPHFSQPTILSPTN